MPKKHDVTSASRQEQFLDVIGRDEATERFQRHLTLAPVGVESVSLAAALGRVLAADILSDVDVPAFDRSNVDGFAICAADSFEAMEETPRAVTINEEVLAPGIAPQLAVQHGSATPIATGGMLPRGADAVVMIEDTELVESGSARTLEVRRAVAPGANITFAGTDIARGETVLRAGSRLTSREIGVLAAIGLAEVDVFRKPRVAIISTGDEIVPPGTALPPGGVYDSNLAILSAAVEELGGEAVPLGIVTDDEGELLRGLERALKCDVVLLSGGTSKGAGDLSYRVISKQITRPGIVAHGVSLKPGKPICLAVHDGKPVVILPGFPTSAIFTFHEFVAPVIRAFAGRAEESRETVQAELPLRVNSERGRTEFLLVSLVKGESGLAAYPMGKGSGSVTTFSNADGFITIPPQTEIVDAGSDVEVQLLGRSIAPAELIVIGSHCVGLDLLLGELQRRGVSTKSLYVGSTGGIAAAKRGECDIAGIHLLDAETGEYNRPFLSDDLELIPGYRRMQGIVFRADDKRFAGKTTDEFMQRIATDSACTMVNRNAGSGTRILIDRLLAGEKPHGYAVQAKSHNAVAAAVSSGRADWGVAIDTVARMYNLGFIPLQEEQYDFVVPKKRSERPGVAVFRALLAEPTI
ncbi:MAG: molybdopterin biosynthesis protein, partial [Planctomycetaceae bacterium]